MQPKRTNTSERLLMFLPSGLTRDTMLAGWAVVQGLLYQVVVVIGCSVRLTSRLNIDGFLLVTSVMRKAETSEMLLRSVRTCLGETVRTC